MRLDSVKNRLSQIWILESFCDSYFSFPKIFLIFILSCYYLIFL